jgi:hypothetical protein
MLEIDKATLTEALNIGFRDFIGTARSRDTSARQ